MKISWLIVQVVALVRVAQASQPDLFEQLPQCALSCLESSIGQSSCAPTDLPCLCGDEQFMAVASACQATNCTIKEVLTSTNATLNACGVAPKDQSEIIHGISGSFGSVALLMTCLRVVDRTWLNQMTLGWDDYYIMLAMLIALPVNGLCIAAAHFGLGKDMWTIPFPHIDLTFKLVYVAEIFYMASEMFVQLSLLAFLLRVFSAHRLKIYVHIMMGVVIAFGISNTVVMIFPNNPINFFWTGWAGEKVGTSINMNLYCWLRAGIEIGIDISIICLPLPHLWRLQMGMRKKLQVLAMFCVGFCITVVSILRLRSLIQYSKTQNPTYDNAAAIYWSVLENDMFIICACMPAMRPLLKKASPRLFGSSEDSMAHDRGRQKDYRNDGHYYRHESHEFPSSQNAEPKMGVITKAIDVVSYRTGRSESDVELVKPVRERGF